MVAGYERLNEKQSQPNPHVVFIKPLEGPDKEIAQDFLERIAAQCRELMIPLSSNTVLMFAVIRSHYARKPPVRYFARGVRAKS
jgi:hypothetical protein